MLLKDAEIDEFNKDAIESRQGMTWDEAMEEFVDSERKLLNCYRELSEHEPNDALIEFVTYCIGWDVNHYLGHIASLK